MPIYMDRHDLDEPVSRVDLAMAHYQDILIQDKHGCKTMTYWHSDDHKTVFCLIHAPNPEKLKELHAASHGLVPHNVIEVDPAEVEALLGRTSDPVPVKSMETYEENVDEYSAAFDSAFRVIMFTDLQDSTQMMTELGDEKAFALLQKHNDLTRKAVMKHRGNEVKHTGDGFMISFLTNEDALACACSIQNAFAAHNQKNPEAEMHIRIGLSAGEPVFESNDFFGMTVIMANRLCDHTEPDSVLVSTDVHDASKDTDFVFIDMGDAMLKGFKEAVQVFQVTE